MHDDLVEGGRGNCGRSGRTARRCGRGGRRLREDGPRKRRARGDHRGCHRHRLRTPRPPPPARQGESRQDQDREPAQRRGRPRPGGDPTGRGRCCAGLGKDRLPRVERKLGGFGLLEPGGRPGRRRHHPPLPGEPVEARDRRGREPRALAGGSPPNSHAARLGSARTGRSPSAPACGRLTAGDPTLWTPSGAAAARPRARCAGAARGRAPRGRWRTTCRPGRSSPGASRRRR